MFSRPAFVIVFDNTGYAVKSTKCASKKAALKALPLMLEFCNRQNEWIEHTAVVKTGANLYEFTYSPRNR